VHNMVAAIEADGELPARSMRRFLHGLQLACIGTMLGAAIAPQELASICAWLSLAGMSAIFLTGLAMGRHAIRQFETQRAIATAARATGQQIEELFAMTDMLQSAEAHDDAAAVLMATARRLLPDFSGAMYVFNNSRDRMDLATTWNVSPGFEVAEALLPSACWTLKRGKPHINDPHTNTLCCSHAIGTGATVEIPMMARGAVYGLLILGIEGADGYRRLKGIRRLCRALADSMSLALSNIALREKLRTQSLRDPLTGLYNRRYMEDALERFVSLAERNGAPTSVVMLDLDHFKRLNDTMGHAKGDAVLRDVAAQLVGGLRPSDVIARYGGEELIVILPGCSLDDASAKAELLRARVESLSEAHGTPISASFGVACVPETSTGAMDVVPMADSALYAAKQAGRNCIRNASRRGERDEQVPQARLVIA